MEKLKQCNNIGNEIKYDSIVEERIKKLKLIIENKMEIEGEENNNEQEKIKSVKP